MNHNLRVSISTDAVIYLPFYLAYFGGDFKDTPFGSVDVSIVGLNDAYFKFKESSLIKGKVSEPKTNNPRLRGDAFMTLDVLLDVADIGIGDPGFVSIIRKENRRVEYYEKKDIKRYLNYLNISQFDEQSKVARLNTNNTPETLKKIFVEECDLRILAGLIRKPALKAIVGQTKAEFENSNPKFKEQIDKNLLRTKSDQFEKNYELFTYPNPSTSNNLLNSICNKSNKKITKSSRGDIEFGYELMGLKDNEICLSCDFIAIDYLHNNTEGKYYIIDDFVCNDKVVLWSGIIADYKKIADSKKEESFQAFLYAIDKNLAFIEYFIKRNEKYELHNYIKAKLTNDPNKISDILKILIADEYVTNEFKDITKMESPIDSIIELITDNLFRWKANSTRLYCSSTEISLERANHNTAGEKFDKTYLEEIENIFLVREDKNELNINSDLVFPDLLKKWRIREMKINEKNKIKWLSTLIKDKNYLQFVTIIIALLGIMSFFQGIFDVTVYNILGISKFCWELIGLGLMIIIFIAGLWLYKRSKLLSQEKYVYRKK